ncbi:PREDICTED: agamous-like MADS-box protein AGL36 [Camelina sativa]|uniref:Agamous-like MADS-box protein AGL36 n=1 Tax=Camelina sativa TaxID=90675 RepID=A0ABM0VII3_CAMSA|nr:PREDICTED: agamous-like MADS-box protein AGL36 [Camelina sativa]
MRKLKLSLIANERSRKKTFMKRKKGITKKLHELTTLCGVQACGVIYSPYQSVPEVWPSKEGAHEVAMKFMEMSMATRTKKMMDQDTYYQTKEQVDKLAVENLELQVKRFMFDCLEGKMSEYHYGANDLHDLHRYIDQYINQLTQRMKSLVENGESSSFPPLPIGVADIDPHAVADFAVDVKTAAIGAARDFCAHIPYQNMNMNRNLQEPFQYHTSRNFYGHIQEEVYNNMT